MIRKQDRQASFVDTDYISERLVPKDSFYRKFRELVTPLMSDESFEDMYCPDNGRPAIQPSLLSLPSKPFTQTSFTDTGYLPERGGNTDHLGSTGYITDNNGEILEHIEYTPHGESWYEAQSSSLYEVPDYRFTGGATRNIIMRSGAKSWTLHSCITTARGITTRR